MKKTKKRLVIAITALSLVILLLISFTLAYFTDQRRTLNVLGLGTGSGGSDDLTVKIKLTEPGFAATPGVITTVMNPGETDEFSKIELYDILPNQKVNKDPLVTNIGREAVYVRVKLSQLVYDENGTLTGTLPVDLSAAPYSVLDAAVDSSKWTYKPDGYWYYNTKLEPTSGSNSVAVLVNKGSDSDPYTMKMPEDISNTDISTLVNLLNLEVTAEAIQSREFTQDLTSDTPWTKEDNTTPVPIIPAVRS